MAIESVQLPASSRQRMVVPGPVSVSKPSPRCGASDVGGAGHPTTKTVELACLAPVLLGLPNWSRCAGLGAGGWPPAALTQRLEARIQ